MSGGCDAPFGGGRVVGFTGAREVGLPMLSRAVAPALHELTMADEYVTGAAKGVDAYAGLALFQAYPKARHTVIVPGDRKQVDVWWAHFGPARNLRVIELAAGTTYALRNQCLVDEVTDTLLAFPLWPESSPRSRHSGTWQTVRMMRRRNDARKKDGLPEIPIAVRVLTNVGDKP